MIGVIGRPLQGHGSRPAPTDGLGTSRQVEPVTGAPRWIVLDGIRWVPKYVMDKGERVAIPNGPLFGCEMELTEMSKPGQPLSCLVGCLGG